MRIRVMAVVMVVMGVMRPSLPLGSHLRIALMLHRLDRRRLDMERDLTDMVEVEAGLGMVIAMMDSRIGNATSRVEAKRTNKRAVEQM